MASETNKYLDLTGLGELVTKVKAEDEKRVPKSTLTAAHDPSLVKVGTNANGLVENDDLVAVTYADIKGLSGFVDNNDNQTVKAGSTTFGANDAVEIAAGSNISVTPDATNKKITIAYTGVATDHNQTVKGNGTAFDADAAVNVAPGTHITVTANTTDNSITVAQAADYTATDASFRKIGQDAYGNVVLGSAIAKSDITGLGIPGADTNQTIKGAGTAFDSNDAIDIVAGTNVTVTPDTTNKKITISSSYTDTNQKIKVGSTTFGVNAEVAIAAGTHTSVTVSGNTITIGQAADYTATTAAAVKVGQDAYGNVVLGSALDYSDLANRPTIGNGKLTIQAAGTQKGTFTANQTGDTTINITASDLGLESAMHFIGVGQTSAPTAGNYVHDATTELYIPKTTSGTLTEVDAAKGDVFINGNKEYVFVTAGKYATPNASQLLGDEGSYALKTVKVSAGTGLTGGGDLSADRTISHATYSSQDASAIKVGRDATGHVILGTALGATSSSVSNHTHTVYGYVDVPTVSATSNTYGNTTGTTTVVTSYPGATSKLVTTSIVPATSNGSVVPAVANGTVNNITLGTSTSASKAAAVSGGFVNGTANCAASKTQVATGLAGSTVFITSAATDVYNASYDDTNCCLTLSAVTLNTGSVTVSTTNIQEAVQATATLPYYSFSDVTVPVVSGTASVEVAKAGTAVTVAKAGTAITVATGALSADGTGSAVMTGLGTANTASVLNKADFGTKTGGTALVNAVTVGSSTVSIQGGTTSAVGGHSHTITIS